MEEVTWQSWAWAEPSLEFSLGPGVMGKVLKSDLCGKVPTGKYGLWMQQEERPVELGGGVTSQNMA